MEPSLHYPKVSVITPSYNQAHYLEATLCSVLDQDYPNLEYIVVDGGSKDGSVAIIQKYQSRLAWWISEKDQGQTDAINKGFSHASGEILAWLNSDDTYFPGAISEAVACLQEHPQAGLVYGDAVLIDEAGKRIGRFASKQTNYQRLLQGSVHIPQATTFFRAGLFRSVGALDISLSFAFDYDLWVRLAKISELLYVPRQWANFRLHEQGKSVMNDDRFYPEMLRVHQREGGGWFSRLRLRYFVRRTFYARLPLEVRIWLRNLIP